MFVLNERQKMKRTKRSKKRRARSRFIKLALCLAIFAATAAVIIAVKSNRTTADESLELNKYYTSITVESGDTLWDIACEYKKSETSDINSYIDEIKSINNLVTDDITAGQDLIIVYYAE